jgi:hypothetical protein
MANTTGQKYGGRQKGGVNIITAEIRNHYQTLITNNIEKLQSDIETLEPLQRLKVIIELSKFVIPQLKATDLIIETEPAVNVINLGAGIAPERQEQIIREEIQKINSDLESKY